MFIYTILIQCTCYYLVSLVICIYTGKTILVYIVHVHIVLLSYKQIRYACLSKQYKWREAGIQGKYVYTDYVDVLIVLDIYRQASRHLWNTCFNYLLVHTQLLCWRRETVDIYTHKNWISVARSLCSLNLQGLKNTCRLIISCYIRAM